MRRPSLEPTILFVSVDVHLQNVQTARLHVSIDLCQQKIARGSDIAHWHTVPTFL